MPVKLAAKEWPRLLSLSQSVDCAVCTSGLALTPGTRLGPYEVIAQIGVGGMGEVYRARDTKLKRDVAIKVLPDVFAPDPDRLARFQREAEVLASLNHPHIAAIYGLEDPARRSSWNWSRARTSPIALRAPIPLDEALPIASRSPRRSKRRTSRASFIAI